MKKAEALRKDLIGTCWKAYQKGWAPGPSGNISVRIPGSDRILLKATGISLGDVKPSDIVTVDFEGNVVEGRGKPSKEARFHLGIYKVRDDVNAVLHSHPTFATSYAAVGIEFPLVTEPGIRTLKRIPLVEYAPAGSEQLASYVVEAFKDKSVKAVILKGHGTVTVGRNLSEAYYLTDLLEDAAKLAFLSSLLKIKAKRTPSSEK